ncbi:hypothetical protein WICPIJ_005965 [Wickerhamomyces pijperi]|uniref:Mitochondrial inner membrane protease subunit n=1 Tax=Wickerhamomyces pijperi TaxID=599730 RepID=A0A9P8TLB3_WICPI|nr:hypothetical protein WICPIJ_005965 [Wickerhamomyces pijperi]
MLDSVKTFTKILSYIIRGGCTIHVFQSTFIEFTETRGESMLPTLNSANDFVFSDKHYRNGRDLKIGDCIVALKPTDPDQRVCKRITGMPGDLILIDPSLKNYYNGNKQEIEFEDSFNKYIRVPKGHVWVTGDNLAHSLDSRSYNSIPLGLVKGKIIAANDFNKPFWENGVIYGFRKIENNYVDEA